MLSSTIFLIERKALLRRTHVKLEQMVEPKYLFQNQNSRAREHTLHQNVVSVSSSMVLS
jgi:hypothetical protein